LISLRDFQQRTYRAIALEEDLALPFGGTSPRRVTGLAVYRNNARETFRRTLATTFPVIEQLVGDDCFRTLALTFARQSPSRAGDLALFGAEFPSMLDVFYRDTSFAYLRDVAALEWAQAEAEIAGGAAALDPLALQQIAPDSYGDLRFVLQPSVRLLASRYPVLSIWQAHQVRPIGRVSLDAGSEHVLVLRRSGAVRLYRLEAGAFAFARALADGETLADAHDAGLAVARPFDFAAALDTLVGLGALAGFRI
jgi:hypothetical protein